MAIRRTTTRTTTRPVRVSTATGTRLIPVLPRLNTGTQTGASPARSLAEVPLTPPIWSDDARSPGNARTALRDLSHA
jgi:hypothetical protein